METTILFYDSLLLLVSVAFLPIKLVYEARKEPSFDHSTVEDQRTFFFFFLPHYGAGGAEKIRYRMKIFSLSGAIDASEGSTAIIHSFHVSDIYPGYKI
jgi:hypothetical protein